MKYFIKSKFSFYELFSYLPLSKFQIVKYNKVLNKKFDIINFLKKACFIEKIKYYYDFIFVKDYFNGLKNDFNNKIDGNEIKDILFNGLSQKENFYLQLSDEYFSDAINSKNLNVEIGNLTTEMIPKIKLTEKNLLLKKVFEEIFNSFSTDGKMNNKQINEFIINTFNNSEKKEKIFNLLSSYLSTDGFLRLDGFYKFYSDIINTNILEKVLNNDNNEKIIKGLDVVWNHLNYLVYNNILEKNKYDFNYIKHHPSEFEEFNETFKNFLELSNKKIFKFLLCFNVEKVFIKYLNEEKVFENVKRIDISISNFNKFIELDIILSNVEELSFYINANLKYMNEINNIFPNIKSLKLYFCENIDLIDLFNCIYNSKIVNLTIFFLIIEKYNISIIKYKIILDKIINLRIEIDKEYDSINELLNKLFNNIQFPNLEKFDKFIKIRN